MTLEQLQAMSDDELNELAAVKVMGWTMQTMSGYMYYDDKENQEIRFVSQHRTPTWYPCADMNDAMRLAEHAVHASKYSDVTISLPMNTVIFHRHTAEELIVDTEDSLPRAITIAAILAK